VKGKLGRLLFNIGKRRRILGAVKCLFRRSYKLVH